MILNRLRRKSSPKESISPQEMLVYDERHRLYYISDPSYHRRVYISDIKRAELYQDGVRARINWILNDYRILPEIIRPGDLVIDIGANSGELALHEGFLDCKYVAIEPDPSAFRALSLNHPQGTLINNAISNTRGTLEFYLATSEADSSLFKPAFYTETIMVNVITLDECMAQHNIEGPIKLLKIEAEGMEPEILQGSMNALAVTKYIALDAGPERGGQPTAPDCLNFLFGRGFRLIDTYLFRGTFLLQNQSM